MDEVPVPAPPAAGLRRSPEDVALDLMKFIALTTGYGKPQSGAGFGGKPAATSAEDYAAALLQLYQRCREAVEGPAVRS